MLFGRCDVSVIILVNFSTIHNGQIYVDLSVPQLLDNRTFVVRSSSRDRPNNPLAARKSQRELHRRQTERPKNMCIWHYIFAVSPTKFKTLYGHLL